jgi:arsenite-transporting ATPase
MNPEKMVVQEARRAYTYLQLYGYGVDSVIVNRILPSDAGNDPGWQKYLESQAKYLQEIEASFSPLPILWVPHMRQEVFGVPLLNEIGSGIYGERNPADIFYKEATYRVTAEGDTYFLDIRLPFTNEKNFTVKQFGDQLVIQIQNQRRNYLLPNFLIYYSLTETTFRDGWLKIRFEQSEDLPGEESASPDSEK